MNEEDIQTSMDNNNPSDDRAYRIVFNALKQEPGYRLPSNFADGVLRRMGPATSKSSSQEMIWLYLGIGAFVVAAGVAIALTGFKIHVGAFRFVSGYSGLFIFGAAFILALQWIDRNFIRKHSL
jgi:hypothetical protein